VIVLPVSGSVVVRHRLDGFEAACESQQLRRWRSGVVYPVFRFLMLHSIDEMTSERHQE